MCGKLTLSIFILTPRPRLHRRQFPLAKDIQPIFPASCWKCHGAAVQLSKLDLRTRQAALAGGVHGSAIRLAMLRLADFSEWSPASKSPPCRSTAS